MVRWKKGVATEHGMFWLMMFVILFALAIFIIYMGRSGPENTNLVLAAIKNMFAKG
jgi:hypothetical protein